MIFYVVLLLDLFWFFGWGCGCWIQVVRSWLCILFGRSFVLQEFFRFLRFLRYFYFIYYYGSWVFCFFSVWNGCWGNIIIIKWLVQVMGLVVLVLSCGKRTVFIFFKVLGFDQFLEDNERIEGIREGKSGVVVTCG